MFTKSIKGQTKLMKVASDNKYYCECGHSVIIYPFERRTKKVCSVCGRYVYINKKEEFKDRLKEKMK